MRETWLHPNRRAILFGCVPLLIATLFCAWLATSATSGTIGSWVGVVGSVLGFVVSGAVAFQLRRPRIAFENGHVLFNMRSGRPIGVPVEIVEAFFAGQGPAHLPLVSNQPQTVNLVARLARRNTEWASRPVREALGSWNDSYVIIRGSWCEPLDGELIRKLNRRLKEAKEHAAHGTP